MLSHPHIVRLIDSGVFGAGLLYAVFEHVPGTTLRQVLAEEGRLDQDEAVRLMSQVLDALACAHAQGVVHRDLKPENVMVTRTGLRRNAEAHLIAGDVAAGLAVTAEGLERCERELARVQEPELFRLEGELRARAGDDVAAEAALRRGLALAQARGARAWELRAAASLARFLAERGRAA